MTNSCIRLVFVYLSTDGITWCIANFAYFNLFSTVVLAGKSLIALEALTVG